MVNIGSRFLVDWSKAPPAKYTRTVAVEVLSPSRIRYEFDNGNAAEYDALRGSAVAEAREWVERCRQHGAEVTP